MNFLFYFNSRFIFSFRFIFTLFFNGQTLDYFFKLVIFAIICVVILLNFIIKVFFCFA